MYSKKNRGPRIDPWGTPQEISFLKLEYLSWRWGGDERRATAVLLSFSVVQFDFVRGFYEHNGNFSRSPRPSSCCMLWRRQKRMNFYRCGILTCRKILTFLTKTTADLTWNFTEVSSFRRSVMTLHTFLRSTVLALKIQVLKLWPLLLGSNRELLFIPWSSYKRENKTLLKQALSMDSPFGNIPKF